MGAHDVDVNEFDEEEVPTGCFDRAQIMRGLSQRDSGPQPVASPVDDDDLLFADDEVSQSRISVRPRGPACLSEQGSSGLDAATLFDDLPLLGEPTEPEPARQAAAPPALPPPAPAAVPRQTASAPAAAEPSDPETELRRMKTFVLLLCVTVLATAAYVALR